MNHNVIDPVCGMSIDPAHAAGTSQYGEETFHFCASSCKTTFDAAPQKFVRVAEEPAVSSCCGGGHCAMQ
ncbi:MAG TPA: YHS domain-containing protein [Thermoanaerobaculia bacterium]|jgi:Cu+-exporting ATPase